MAINTCWHIATGYFTLINSVLWLMTVPNMNKIEKLIAIITQIGHRAKCVSNIWYLITVPNMNKINTFFSEKSQQTHKLYEKK